MSTDSLNAGGMGYQGESGMPAHFANSLASYIEQAYWNSLSNDHKKTFALATNTESDRDRRRIFVAIAQGVVKYLHDHPHAFTVTGTGLPADVAVSISTQVPSP
jgi:hypothetical protein